MKLAMALGAKPLTRLHRPLLSFPVYEPPSTHHAEFLTEAGPFAWLWLLDATHTTINPPPGWQS